MCGLAMYCMTSPSHFMLAVATYSTTIPTSSSIFVVPSEQRAPGDTRGVIIRTGHTSGWCTANTFSELHLKVDFAPGDHYALGLTVSFRGILGHWTEYLREASWSDTRPACRVIATMG